MQLNDSVTVREIAIEMPGATRVFEKMGIDYCCGGARPITEACQAAGVSVEEVVQSLEQVELSMQAPDQATDWRAVSLASLITHIKDRHHHFTREELDGIEPLLAKVCSVYSERRPELLQIQALFGELKLDLLLHMKKEENILFPYITEIEHGKNGGEAVPAPMFGTVRNPVQVMMAEHDTAGDILRNIRQLSNDFAAPSEACISYRTLYSRLEELEQDLHQHIHLENNVLFPRAIEVEG